MMGSMNETPSTSADSTSIECGTCVAAGTTACTDCLVTHLLANDDGPVDFVPVELAQPRPDHELVIELFRQAGLVDDPVVFVAVEEFDSVGPYAGVGAPARPVAVDRRDP